MTVQQELRGPLAPVLDALSRLTGEVETERARRDRETIEELRKEVADLRAAVVHLRVARTPLPSELRPAVARSLVDVP